MTVRTPLVPVEMLPVQTRENAHGLRTPGGFGFMSEGVLRSVRLRIAWPDATAEVKQFYVSRRPVTLPPASDRVGTHAEAFMMTYQQYYDLTRQGAELFEKGDHANALKVFQSIVESDLPDLDRATMSVNVATVCDKMGHQEHALAWYDHGIALEEPHARFFVLEKKAEYFVALGRPKDALEIYEGLAGEPFVTMNDLERINHNRKVLRGDAPGVGLAGRVGV